MPVSRTEKTMRARRGPVAAATRTSPRSVNFSALEMKLRRICDTLPSSVCSGGSPLGSSKTSSTASLVSSGRSMPRSAPNSSATSNSVGSTIDLAGLDLGEVEQVVDQLEQALGRRARCSATCRSCSVGERRRRCGRAAAATAPGSSSAACGTRGSCSRGTASSSRRPAQLLGALVELGVQRHHAAVGVLELAC